MSDSDTPLWRWAVVGLLLAGLALRKAWLPLRS